MANSNPYWDLLRKIGWLNYVPQGQHDELFQQIEKNLASEEPGMTWLGLVQGTFEPGSDSIDDVLAMLQKMSQSKFAPTNMQIKANAREDRITVSFDHTGKTFSDALPAESDMDWFNSLLRLANKAVESGGAKERFIQLPSDDFINIVFVPPTVLEAAVKGNLLPTNDMDSDD